MTEGWPLLCDLSKGRSPTEQISLAPAKLLSCLLSVFIRVNPWPVFFAWVLDPIGPACGPRFDGRMPEEPKYRHKPDPRGASTVDAARDTNITAQGEQL